MDYIYNEETQIYTVTDENGAIIWEGDEDEFEDKFYKCELCWELVDRDELDEEHTNKCSDIGMDLCECCLNCNNNIFWCRYHEQWEYEQYGGWVYLIDVDERCCRDAADNYCYFCDGCRQYFWYDEDLSYHERNGETYCSSCYPDEDEYEYGIILDYHGHSMRKKSQFCDDLDRSKVIHMGVELEVHNDSNDISSGEAAEYVDNKLGDYVMFERDCTIDPGFEIITRPASLEYHLEKDWQNVMRNLISSGFVSHNKGKCGLHVHLDRNYFGKSSELAEAKFLWIFEKHWDNLCRFSRRRNFEWCDKVKKPVSLSGEDMSYAYLVKYNRSRASDHGVAVNIGNENTIEIRLWRGTLRYETFIATLKFTARLAELIKSKSVMALSKMSWENILGDDTDIIEYWETVKDRQTNE